MPRYAAVALFIGVAHFLRPLLYCYKLLWQYDASGSGEKGEKDISPVLLAPTSPLPELVASDVIS